MSEGSEDRVAAFEADIAASAAALDRLLGAWAGPVDLGAGPFVMTGLGSSRFAASVVAAALRSAGRVAWDAHPAEVVAMPPVGELAVIAISASGRTAEVVGAAERHRGHGPVVAVTNAVENPLASVADVTMPLHAGDEASGIACRSFRATIATLALATGLRTPDDLAPMVQAVDARLTWLATALPSFADTLDGAPSIDVLADATAIGLADQAALMLREAPRLPAHAFETADWLHTGVYLALPGHRVLLFEGSPADDEVVATVERRGGAVVRIARPAGHEDPIGRAIVDSVVAERLAAALWRRATATG